MFGMEKKLGNKLAMKFAAVAKEKLDAAESYRQAGDQANAALWYAVANTLYLVGQVIHEVVNED